MGVSCRACGIDGPGEGVFSLSEVAYDGAIPGDGRIFSIMFHSVSDIRGGTE